MKKNTLFGAVAIATLLLAVACGSTDRNTAKDHHGQHNMAGPDTTHVQHMSLADNFAHTELLILPTPVQLSASAQASMVDVLNAYLSMADALTKDDIEAADRAIEAMLQKVEAVGTLPDTVDEKGAWRQHAALYSAKLQEMLHVEGLEAKRSYFGHISEAMYCTVKSFAFERQTVYANFCPMVFDNKGAYWLSSKTQIENPYMGTKMPKCGEQKEEL